MFSALDIQQLQDENGTALLIQEALENLILSCTEPFTLVKSNVFLWLLYLCLNCKHPSIVFPKADALTNSVMK